jgi:hypothetical protein
MKALDACYELEKSQVRNVISECSTQAKSDECIEIKLVQLVHQGSAMAEMTLLELYKSQNNMSKISTLQRELAGIRTIQMNSLQKCLESKIK